jgi:DNA helicase-2/ATP-dependent DNA helicase PcrA
MNAVLSAAQFQRVIVGAEYKLDDAQRAAIESDAVEGLLIVAGPGAGKTTCLFLRVLKLMLVDGVPPAGIIATTFTRKAAEELRSRILGKGFLIMETAASLPRLSTASRKRLRQLDINQIWTGTLDQLCAALLRDHRVPGQQPPVLLDDFLSKTLMLRKGLLAEKIKKGHPLDDFFIERLGALRFGYGPQRRTEMAMTLWGRRFQDLVDWDGMVNAETDNFPEAIPTLVKVFEGYGNELENRAAVDFAMLEYRVLDYLEKGHLETWLAGVKVLLVDEYQDTNPLQERIYFEIASRTGGALTVVGDDDQSLYRFRGATVELFRDFAARYRKRFKRPPSTVFLSVNYRSSANIIGFVNRFVGLDRQYQQARVKDKPPMTIASGAETGTPVLGMFRESREALAQSVADFIYKVFRGSGYRLPDGSLIRADVAGADIGDCALLCASPKETNGKGEKRLAGLLRAELGSTPSAIRVFNPRGQDFHEIPIVECFGGLLTECIDPEGRVQQAAAGFWRDDERDRLSGWRAAALAYLEGSGNSTLVRFVDGWRRRAPSIRGRSWPVNSPILQLIYSLVHFFPGLHDDPEGQVLLEVFVRQIQVLEELGGFRGRLVHQPTNQELSDRSVRALLEDFLRPILLGVVKIDEEMVESFPRDRLSILSIHQSKGLEFPVAIVDVSSDFKTNHHGTRPKRFPDDPGGTHLQEDFMRAYTDLQTETRSGRDRAFDDLIRQYFVAFSRAQSLLLLVGVSKGAPPGQVPNVATGWDRAQMPSLAHINSLMMI